MERLKIARDFGDLSENSEYDAAKKEQTVVETEIASIEETLRKATIITKKEKLNWLEWVLLIAFLFTVGLQMVRGITMDMGWIADDDATYVAMAADVSKL